jgi:hypothetical protein
MKKLSRKLSKEDVLKQYLRGWTDGASVRMVNREPQNETYSAGWADGRDAFYMAANKERETLGLPTRRRATQQA